MPTQSMRRQTRETRLRDIRDERRQQDRERAVKMLRENKKWHEIMETCNMSAGTLNRIKKCLSNNATNKLQKFLNPK